MAGDERPGPRQGRSALLYAPSDPGQDPRHVGTIETLWNLFDLTPEAAPPAGTSSWPIDDGPRLTADRRRRA
jgi:hypothetical protein